MKENRKVKMSERNRLESRGRVERVKEFGGVGRRSRDRERGTWRGTVGERHR